MFSCWGPNHGVYLVLNGTTNYKNEPLSKQKPPENREKNELFFLGIWNKNMVCNEPLETNNVGIENHRTVRKTPSLQRFRCRPLRNLSSIKGHRIFVPLWMNMLPVTIKISTKTGFNMEYTKHLKNILGASTDENWCSVMLQWSG